MLLTKALRDCFTDGVQGIPGWMGNLPDREPHRAFAVRISGGLGLQVEDALDFPSFALLTRGINPADAETWAYALDNFWLDSPSMFSIGGYETKGKGRLGGPPTYAFTDDLNRVIYACNYWTGIER